jgi:O-Antigen ligase
MPPSLDATIRPLPTTRAPQAPVNKAETGSLRRPAGALTRSPELIPGALAVAVFVLWAIFDGGTSATKSYPGALFVLGLLVATAFGLRSRLANLSGPTLWAIGLLAAFSAWSFLSIAWAGDQGAAWDGANRCLLYLTVFALFAITPWRARTGALILGGYAVVMAAIAAITVLSAAGSAEPHSYLIASRFATPAGYYNANAALFTAAFFPAVLFASRREVPWPLRGLLLASASVLFDFALLPQSRGWVIAAPIAMLAYLLIVPDRVRSLIVLGPLSIVAALTASPMLRVYNDVAGGGLGAALDGARNAMLIGAAAMFLVGALIGLADGRVQLSEANARMGTRAIGGIACLAGLAGVVVAIAVVGNPVSWVGDRWHDFKTGRSEPAAEGSRLGQGLGSNRYDFWRVGADEFTAHPVAGVGSGNFAEDYVRERETSEEPTEVHNLPLSVFSQTGLVGGLILIGFLTAVLVGMGHVRLRSADPLARAVTGVAAAIFVYVVVHSTGDWFWLFPAIWAPVFAWLGVGMALGRGPRAQAPQEERPRRWPTRAAAAAITVFAAASFALPWVAAVQTNRASHIWGADPQAAYRLLDHASDLNFLSANPDLVKGGIASRLDQPRVMRDAFSEALKRDPNNWYATLELATLDAVDGDRQAALDRLRRVAELNPREPLTARVRQGLLSNHPLSPQKLDAVFLERYCAVLGRQVGPGGCVVGR